MASPSPAILFDIDKAIQSYERRNITPRVKAASLAAASNSSIVLTIKDVALVNDENTEAIKLFHHQTAF